MMSNINWVNAAQVQCPPPNAVAGGVNAAGEHIFVGRAIHECDDLAANIILSKGAASVTYGGREILKKDFEFLVGSGFEWTMGENGAIPKYAVPTGTAAYGETLFVGRVHHDQVITLGTLYPSHGCCFYPHNEIELRANSYEILVQKPLTRWVPFNVNCSIMDDAVKGGMDSDGATIYIGRAHFNDDLIPACVIPEKRAAYVTFSGRAESVHRCEILCGTKLFWITHKSGPFPNNAVVGGRTNYDEPLYIGRTYAGANPIPGKIHRSHGCLYIPLAGLEVRHYAYEILVIDESPI